MIFKNSISCGMEVSENDADGKAAAEVRELYKEIMTLQKHKGENYG
jgi:hypothetical protein